MQPSNLRQTSAQRCISIREIFENIAWVPVDRDDSWSRAPWRSADLLALALVCRAFTPVCLDALWYTCNDISPLFDLLPSGVIKRASDVIEVSGHQQFTL
jgi:hypothetical protein